MSKESLPLDKINGIKILKDCALCDYVNRNGFDPLRSDLRLVYVMENWRKEPASLL